MIRFVVKILPSDIGATHPTRAWHRLGPELVIWPSTISDIHHASLRHLSNWDADQTFRLFYGFWPDADGRGQTNLVVEQVSHHPPITAYFICNPSKGLALQGHSAQKTSFSGGSIIVKQIGHAVLTVDLPGGGQEEFLITLPRLRIDGLWYGSPYIELAETSYIQSSSGWLSTVRPAACSPDV